MNDFEKQVLARLDKIELEHKNEVAELRKLITELSNANWRMIEFSFATIREETNRIDKHIKSIYNSFKDFF